jgi:hypothetical protein
MKTAILVVNKDWVNTGVYHLLNKGLRSTSESQGHFLILPFDHQDPSGVWLADIETSQLTSDGSPVKMNTFLVRWEFIYAMGIVDGDVQNAKIGFPV